MIINIFGEHKIIFVCDIVVVYLHLMVKILLKFYFYINFKINFTFSNYHV